VRVFFGVAGMSRGATKVENREKGGDRRACVEEEEGGAAGGPVSL
jgi:hypothetical protein